MAHMTQIELINLFLKEDLNQGDAGNGHVKCDQYLHYWTPILERYGEKYIFNQTRYSIATGQIQKRIKSMIPPDKLIIVSKVPVNYEGSLIDFL